MSIIVTQSLSWEIKYQRSENIIKGWGVRHIQSSDSGNMQTGKG